MQWSVFCVLDTVVSLQMPDRTKLINHNVKGLTDTILGFFQDLPDWCCPKVLCWNDILIFPFWVYSPMFPYVSTSASIFLFPVDGPSHCLPCSVYLVADVETRTQVMGGGGCSCSCCQFGVQQSFWVKFWGNQNGGFKGIIYTHTSVEGIYNPNPGVYIRPHVL